MITPPINMEVYQPIDRGLISSYNIIIKKKKKYQNEDNESEKQKFNLNHKKLQNLL